MKKCDTCIYRSNVEQLKPCIIYRDDCEYYEKEREDMADDLISRQVVLDIINFEDKWLADAKGHNADTEIAFSGMKSRIAELPPVNPQEPKIGHWEGSEDDIDVLCSECGDVGYAHYNYCPNCGFRMVEPQESEG